MAKIGIVGLVELETKLEGIANTDFKKALEKCAVRVRDTAKEKVPVDTGELQKSLTYEFESDYTVAVGTNKFYAPYVEIGTGIFAGEYTNGMYNQYVGTGRQDGWVYFDEATGQFYYTRGQIAKPFLLPSLLENEAWIKQELGRAVKKEVDK